MVVIGILQRHRCVCLFPLSFARPRRPWPSHTSNQFDGSTYWPRALIFLVFDAVSCRVTLLVRLVFFKVTNALAAANVIQPLPSPVLPDQWLTEAEVLPYLAWGTDKLSYGEDVQLSGQWISALLLVAYICRLVGTTGFCFVIFACAFSLPRGYELKKPEVDAAYGVAKGHAERLRQSGEAKAQSAIEYVRQLSTKAAPGKAKEAEEEKKKL
jgi:hypothetical protein